MMSKGGFERSAREPGSLPRSLLARVAMEASLLTLSFLVAAAILVFFGIDRWAESDARKTVRLLLSEIQDETTVIENGTVDKGEAVVKCGRPDQPPIIIMPPTRAPRADRDWTEVIAYLQCGNDIRWISSAGIDEDKWTRERMTKLALSRGKNHTGHRPFRVSSEIKVIEWVAGTDSGPMWRGQHIFPADPENSEVTLTAGVISLGGRIREDIWSLWKYTFLPLAGGIVLVGVAIAFASLRRIRPLTRLSIEIYELSEEKRGELFHAGGDPDEIALIIDRFNEYIETQRSREITFKGNLERMQQLLQEVRNGEHASRHAIGRLLEGLVAPPFDQKYWNPPGPESRATEIVKQLKDIVSYRLDADSIRVRCDKLQTATDATRVLSEEVVTRMLKNSKKASGIEEFKLDCRLSERELPVWVGEVDLKEMLSCLIDNAVVHSGDCTKTVLGRHGTG